MASELPSESVIDRPSALVRPCLGFLLSVAMFLSSRFLTTFFLLSNIWCLLLPLASPLPFSCARHPVRDTHLVHWVSVLVFWSVTTLIDLRILQIALKGYRLDHRLGYLILSDLIGGAALPGRYRITLAPVRPHGHVLHLIRAILHSLQISYFSTDAFFLLFFQSFCSHAEDSMKFGS